MYSGPRGVGNGVAVQNVNGPLTLNNGDNIFMQKTYNRGGGYGMRMALLRTNVATVMNANTFPASQVEIVLWPDTATAQRDILTPGFYVPSTPFDVRITVTLGAGSPSPVVTENVPAGWTIDPTTIQTMGSVAFGIDQITWTLGTLTSPTAELVYRITPAASATGDATFNGTVVSGTFSTGIAGDSLLLGPVSLGIFDWHGDIGIEPVGQATGNPSIPGSATEAGSVYTVTGAGADVWDTVDRCHLAAKYITGDFAVEATITWIDPGTNVWSKAGLMARQDLGASSVHGWVGVRNPANTGGSSGGDVVVQWRDNEGGGSNPGGNPTEPYVAPVKVRLTRIGPRIIGHAWDGTNWVPGKYPFDHVLPGMTNDAIALSIFVTSHADDSSGVVPPVDDATATFQDIVIHPVSVTRAVRTIGVAQYVVGTSVPVSIAIEHQNDSSPLTVEDVLPPGWAAVNISDGGTQVGQTVTWVLGSFASDTVVTYGAMPAFTLEGSATWGAGITQDQNDVIVPIEGDATIVSSAGGVAAYWPLDEGTGTVAADVVGGHDGALNADVSWVATGRHGAGALFAGPNTGDSYIECGDGTGYWNSRAGTLALWFLTAAQHTPQPGFFLWGSSNNGDGFGGQNEFHFGFDNDDPDWGRVQGWGRGDPDITLNSPRPPDYNDNVWHHGVLTWDRASDFVMYIDGVEVARQSYASARDIDFTQTRMGQPWTAINDEWRAFNGALDDVRIYTYAFTPPEVSSLFFATPGVPAAPTSLAASPFANRRVQLTWDSSAITNERGYVIQAKLNSGTQWADVATAPLDATGVVVINLANFTLYDFRVRAYSASGFSAYSNVASSETNPALGARRWELYR